MEGKTRWALGVLVILIALLSIPLSLGSGESRNNIYLEPSHDRVTINSEFYLFVVLKTEEKIGALQFYVQYNPEIFTVEDVVLIEDSGNVLFQRNKERNKVRIAMVSLSGIPRGNIIKIKFKAVAEGKGDFQLYLEEATDTNADPLSFSVGTPVRVVVLPEQTSSFTGSQKTSPTNTHSEQDSGTGHSVPTSEETTTGTSTTPTQILQTTSSSQQESHATVSPSTTTPPISSSSQTKEPTSTETSSPKTNDSSEGISPNISSKKSSLDQQNVSFRITILSSPPGAQVYVDGHMVGKTPLFIEVGRGTYRIQVVYGNVSKERTVEVKENGSISLSFVLSNNTEFTTTTKEKNLRVCGPGLFILLAIIIGGFANRKF